MRINTHAEITHTHHTARWLSVLKRWVIINQDQEIMAVVTTTTADHVIELTVILVLGDRRLAPRTLTRPGGMRTAIRWVCQELNNGNLWLGARLHLEREARLLDYSEPELLGCWHAYDYQYCLRLLTNLPGLLDWESTRG